MRRLSILIALIAVACGSRALAPATPGPVALTATGTSFGVTLRLDLDRASMAPGQELWATITMENTGNEPVRWVGGGCNVPGNVQATVAAMADFGKNWDYGFAEIKKRLVTVYPQGYASLVDEETWRLRSSGGRACTADIRINELAAHAKLTSRWVWEGTIDGMPAPTGDVTISASLEMDDPRAMVGRTVGASLTLPFNGGSALQVSSARAFDAALEDARFASWIRARYVASGNSEPGAYNVTGGARLVGDEWVISAFQKAAPAGEIEVHVSAIDGSVRSVREK